MHTGARVDAYKHPRALSNLGMRAHLMAVVLLAGSAREAELAVGECEAKLLEQRQTIASLQSTAASINRVKAEAAAAQHERDTMAKQLRAALEQTRKMEIACQEWIAEMQREARLSMARHSSFPVGATVRAHSGADCPSRVCPADSHVHERFLLDCRRRFSQQGPRATAH